MSRFSVVFLLLLMTNPVPAQTGGDSAYKARLAWWTQRAEDARLGKGARWTPIFDCDYTSKLCVRGFRAVVRGASTSVYEIIDDKDRKTVLDSAYCETSGSIEICRFVGSGKVTISGQDSGTW